jgi:hypothetical protein
MLVSGTNGNWLAACAILAWPIVTVAFYRTRPPVEATLWTILGALLLLPAGFAIKLPMIPAMDKNSIPNICAFIGCLFLVPQRRRQSSGLGLVELLASMLILGPVVTSTFNNDTIVIGERVLPGVGYYDGISALLSQLFVFIPFLLGRRIFQNPEDTATTIRCLMIAGLFYSLPMLLEVRLSPQLSNWIYGFFSSGFDTEVRYGGFRPVVFMPNGLSLAFFTMTTLLASVALWRVNDRIMPLPAAGPSAYLGLIVILCKSGGALVYSVFGGYFVRYIKPRAQLRLALLLACVGLSYPLLRITDLFPDRFLVQTAASVDEERAHSLQVRFDQERQLLDHASERFFFGWGRYGRNRVYEESGKDSSLTDGEWILTVGQFGLVGFLAEFGLLAWPIFRATSAFKFVRTERDRIFLATLTLIVALGIIEQLPNASISSWSWLLAGSLLGRAERLVRVARRTIKRTGKDNLCKGNASDQTPPIFVQKTKKNSLIRR